MRSKFSMLELENSKVFAFGLPKAQILPKYASHVVKGLPSSSTKSPLVAPSTPR